MLINRLVKKNFISLSDFLAFPAGIRFSNKNSHFRVFQHVPKVLTLL